MKLQDVVHSTDHLQGALDARWKKPDAMSVSQWKVFARAQLITLMKCWQTIPEDDGKKDFDPGNLRKLVYGCILLPLAPGLITVHRALQ